MAVTLSGSEATTSDTSYILTTSVSEGAGTDTLKIVLGGLSQPSPITIAGCVTTNGSPTLSTSNSFEDIRKGDAVAGTGIAGGSTVSAKASNTELTLSANATASGTISATFTPPAPTGECLMLTIDKALTTESTGGNSKLTATVTAYTLDGTGKQASPTVAEGVSAGSLTASVSLKNFKENSRQ